MKIGITNETGLRERRVAAAPDAVLRLVEARFEVSVESGAGAEAGFNNEEYDDAGASIVDRVRDVDITFTLTPPGPERLSELRPGSLVIGFLDPFGSTERVAALRERRVTAIALETLPRTTLAQSMDALSSQSTAAGYAAVLVAADASPKFFPMFITAAGTLPPAKLLVLGVGVAGLQAIATAKRLGATVYAYDIRPETQEQVESLGARFVAAPTQEFDAGGYARAVSEDVSRQQQEALAKIVSDVDVLVTTALVPGRKAPILVTSKMLGTMRRGAIIVDMAAATGGNCEATVADEVVEVGGVTVLGPTDLASHVPADASRMFGRNLLSLLDHITESSESGPRLALEFSDEIVAGACITHEGRVINPRLRELLGDSA